MSDETITVADVSDGPGGESGLEAGTAISLPVVEILTGRGFVTGKSGSGKSNTASVVIEKLLENSFPVLIVDSDGEYYGLKEEFEILHVGADEECDIQVSAEHAGKIASLALEENVPIILDVSGYLDEEEASALIRETARQLFAKEKKLKKPFLMLVEECHEYIPEGAGMDQTGKTLIKIGKRGRKHGLGIVGISQRPADVKKDFITQCDWLCWHRLTWDNDTKVVSRILGSKYGEAIEDMGDGEAFLMTDWAESIRRVQFRRKRTFDAGATPGLEDFERPDLKSVSGDLVSELKTITDERERTESELADLRQELDKKNQTINQLERELEEAQDMSEMADTFAQALLRKAEAPYRGGGGRNLKREAARGAATEAGAAGAGRGEAGAGGDAADGDPGTAGRGDDGLAPEPQRRDDDDPSSFRERAGPDQSGLDEYERPAAGGDATDAETEDVGAADAETEGVEGDGDGGGGPDGEDADAAAEAAVAAVTGAGDAVPDANGPDSGVTADGAASNGAGASGAEAGDRDEAADGDAGVLPGASHSTVRDAVPPTDGVDISPARSRRGFDGADDAAAFLAGDELRRREAVVTGVVRAVESLEDVTRGMLGAYRAAGRATPVEAHRAAEGSGERTYAYARNKVLRRAGFVAHRSRGEYAYALPALVRQVYGEHADEQELVEVIAEIETKAGLDDEATA